MSSSGANFGGYLSSFGDTVTKLGQIADQVGSQIDGGIRHVGLNLAQATRNQFSQGQTGQPGDGQPTREARNTSTSSSSVGTPEESPSSGSNGNRFSSGLMGSGGLSGTGNTQPKDFSPNSSINMGCDSCNAKLGFLTRKKTCSECKNVFCRKCVPIAESTTPSSPSRLICSRCKILLQRPPIRTQLMDLRVKDLQRYLISKKVNTKACKEKEDLVELVILENGGIPRPSDSDDIPAAASASGGTASRRDPIERQKSFPKNYVASTHRSDWFEKMEVAGASGVSSPHDEVEDFVMVPSPHRETTIEDVAEEIERNAEPNNGRSAAQTLDEVNSSQQDTADPEDVPGRQMGLAEEDRPRPAAQDRPPPPSSPSLSPFTCDTDVQKGCEDQTTATLILGDPGRGLACAVPEGATAKLTLPGTPDLPPSSVASSPKKFANQGLVYLSEINSAEDLQELSAKQMKDMLAMNRVNFKGVVEKQELLKIVERVWRQHIRSTEEKDKLEDEDLCKICMDNPVDCVMLECGHMCTCIGCGKQMSECPICRQFVVRVVKTFKS